MASIQQAFDNILKRYQEEYFRHLEYIDPRNGSKASNKDLLNEHNQTSSFFTAICNFFTDTIYWFELSVGREAGRIDGIAYIPQEEILLIVESKGLRKGKSTKLDEESDKTNSIYNDLIRTLGEKRKGNEDIAKYKMGISKPKAIYAVTLADIWNCKLERKYTDCAWDDIVFNKQTLGDRIKKFKELVNQDGLYHKWWYSSQHEFGFFLLAMIRELSDSEVATYTFTKSH